MGEGDQQGFSPKHLHVPTPFRGLRRVEKFSGFSSGQLQIGGENSGKELDSLCHQGRGNAGGEKTVCRMQAVEIGANDVLL
jgi:hypothetical protein